MNIGAAIKSLEEAHKIQECSLKGGYDDYNQGLYNGLELALSIMCDKEPVYAQPCRIEIPLTISDKEIAKMIKQLHKGKSEMKVNVLGTVYKIKYIPSLDGRGGETDFYTKEIRISEQEDVPAE